MILKWFVCNRFIQRIFSWFKSDPENQIFFDWAVANTKMPIIEKRNFMHSASLVGGVVLRHHPRFAEMQKDYLEYRDMRIKEDKSET